MFSFLGPEDNITHQTFAQFYGRIGAIGLDKTAQFWLTVYAMAFSVARLAEEYKIRIIIVLRIAINMMYLQVLRTITVLAYMVTSLYLSAKRALATAPQCLDWFPVWIAGTAENIAHILLPTFFRTADFLAAGLDRKDIVAVDAFSLLSKVHLRTSELIATFSRTGSTTWMGVVIVFKRLTTNSTGEGYDCHQKISSARDFRVGWGALRGTEFVDG